LLALLPMSILPLVWQLKEVHNVPVASTSQQCREIWNTVCSRAVWQPMGFVYLYNLLQVGNSAWREFLVTVLKFTSCQLNLILISAYILLYLGIVSYKYFFITWSWRKVYIVTTALNGFFSALQVLLIKGVTFGLSNFWFALGDDAFTEFISGECVSCLGAVMRLLLTVQCSLVAFRPYPRHPVPTNYNYDGTSLPDWVRRSILRHVYHSQQQRTDHELRLVNHAVAHLGCVSASVGSRPTLRHGESNLPYHGLASRCHCFRGLASGLQGGLDGAERRSTSIAHRRLYIFVHYSSQHILCHQRRGAEHCISWVDG
jgi:hypothetical protein